MKLAIPLAVLLLTACAERDPELAARAAGLIPEKAEVAALVADAEAITNPYLRDVKSALSTADHIEFPTLAAAPDFEALAARYGQAAQSAYRGWETDKLNAATFDTLTESLNGIIQRMGPEEGKEFDRVVKYVLMHVSKDPLIAKKSMTSSQISDAEILTIVQSYVHDRTPRELTEMAERFMLADQRTKESAGQP